MKYMRKTPVEAIQWTGDNQREVYDFMNKTVRTCCNMDDGTGNLIMFWKDFARRKFKAVIPKFGWVVREGNTFQFYKDDTFRKTFEEARDDDNNGIVWEGFINAMKEPLGGFDDVFKGFKDVFGAEPSKEALDAIKQEAHNNPNNRFAKKIADFYRDDEKVLDGIKKKLSEGLKDMEGSDTHNATFESVLDEMKELHAKKDKDYGSAFHKSFEEFGVTAGVVRLNDKMERVKSLVKNGKAEVKDDSLLDSLKDLGCYAVMLYVELKNKENGTGKD